MARPRIVVTITTYNRPDELALLLDDIERERERFDADVTVRVYDDGSHTIYGDDRADFYVMTPHRGKVGHWKLIDQTLADLRDVEADFYVFLPDDVRLCHHFFARALSVWEGLPDNRATLSLVVQKGREFGCWSDFPIRRVGDAVEVGWVDGAFLCDRRTLKLLDFRMHPVPESWFAGNSNRGSGVGRQMTRRLLANLGGLYRVDRSLLFDQAVPSVMNGRARVMNPLSPLRVVSKLPDDTVIHTADGVRIACPTDDHIERYIRRGRFYEDDLLGALRSLYRGGTVVDVGAHCGNHTAYFATVMGAGRVVAIEPALDSYQRLVQTVEENDLQGRVRCVRAVVHPTWASASLVPGPVGNTGMTSAVEGGPCPVVWLDDLLVDEVVGLVKIDAEGLGSEVVKTIGATLRVDKPIVAAELRDNDEALATDFAMLDYGYRRTAGPYGKTPVWIYST